MDSLSCIRDLEGVEVVASTESAWGPTGRLGVANLGATGGNVTFDLLVPTSASDIWDYIWQSEKKMQSTEKVQLFQRGTRIGGSLVTAISREGKDDRWDARGPERYRLTFTVPVAAIRPDAPVQVRFLWQDRVMSTAGKS